MSISSIGSGQGVHATSVGMGPAQASTDFASLAQALQSGDVAAAQQAFAGLARDVPWVGRAASAPDSAHAAQPSPVASAIQSLGKALQTGDLPAAQKAFATLQQTTHGARHGHSMRAPPAAPLPATAPLPSEASGGGVDTLA